MKHKALVVGLLTGIMTTGILGSVLAHNHHLVTTSKAGPIKRGETTFDEAKDWFGQPTRKNRHPYQCITVIDARWSGRLRIMFEVFQGEKTAMVAIVKKETLESEEHGELRPHTKKGLHIGDRASELRNKYPNATLHEHDGYNHHILVSNGRGKLEATTADGRVTQLRTFPYEAC